ncbi:MAG: DUF6133 family protein [Oscillospiraceae bacterium]|jgi:hypothetical protein|nr:hypothetical protein [Oscillospiraceae bacterium]
MMNKINAIKTKAINKAVMAVAAAKNKIEETRGSVSEHAIVIIIGVVLGGILLVGLIALMNNVIMPSTEDKVTSMFNMG